MRRAGFFQTLRGKLIFTYTMVTVLALLSLEVMLLLLGAVLSRVTNRDTLGYLSDVVSILPAQARPYLQPGAHDLPGLQRWLQATYDAGYASRPAQGIFDHPAAPLVKSEPMYVLSPEGSVLAAAPASAQGLIGRRYSPPANVPRSQDILDSAQQMDLQSGHISAVKPDGNYLMAVPVRQGQSEGPLAALIILTVQPPPSLASQWWQQFLSIVPGTAIFLLLAVAPFATLFGFVMSRGLNRRLKGLTQAVDAWSEGDFSVQPQDRARDEISYLGMRMRRMAERVQALLHTQQELTLLEERNRLARELHDTVKQETFATLMQVRAAKNQLERDPRCGTRAPGRRRGVDQNGATGAGAGHLGIAPGRAGGAGAGRRLERLSERLVAAFAHPGRFAGTPRAAPAAASGTGALACCARGPFQRRPS